MFRLVISIFISALLIPSCSTPDYRRELIEIDSISSVDPQRAMRMLDSIKTEMLSAPEHEQMYYRLLCIKAPDKAYIKHTSDCDILPLVEYYETKGDKRLLAEAYYYAGRAYLHLNDSPQALEYYQKAIDTLSDKGNEELKDILYFQMGRLFLNQALYSKAVNMYKHAYKYQIERKDTQNAIHTLRDLAYTYNKMEAKDSSLNYYQQAYRLAESKNDSHMKINVMSQMASFYIGKGDYAKAWECLQPGLKEHYNIELSPNYVMALKICMCTGQYGDALFYGKELMNVGTVHAKQTASRSLTELYLMRKDYDNARKYLQSFQELTDSVNRITATESVNRMNSLYNYNLRAKENLALKAENLRKQSVTTMAVTVLCIMVIVFISYVARNRQKQRFQAERLSRVKKELFEQSEEYVRKNNEKLGELEEELKRMSDENLLLIGRIEEQRADLILANEIALKRQGRMESVRARIMGTEIYRTIQEHIRHDKVIMRMEWEELDRMINREIPGFRDNLYSYYTISSHEYHVCMLIRLDISPKDMAGLLGCTPSAVSKVRKRLQEKFFSDSGTAKDFDNFIHSL
ncbi:MAG: tetratricopeptide repeat protein [Paraprevotella sp.]|nr:tetratricopeptide repeat protein [Paraprevotella sp.]